MKIAVLALWAVAPMAAQTQPVIRVTTRLVEVNVIVRDHNGPVRGLTKADFELFDRGKAREIAFFAENAPDFAPKAPDSLPPNVFSNRPEVRGLNPAGVTIVLFDGVNTSAADQIWAKREFLAFLGQVQPRRLAATVARFRGRVDAAPDRPLDRADTGSDPDDAQWNEFLQRTEDEAEERRIRYTADAFEAIARQIGHIPGRKSLIWVSTAFPFENRNSRSPRLYAEYVTRIGRALSSANIAAYPVDARGLIAMPSLTAERRAAANGGYLPPLPVSQAAANAAVLGGPSQNPMAGFYSGPSASEQAVMDMVAQATGGRAFKNTNDVRGAIRTVLDESGATYTLVFHPADGDLDSKFHKLTVKVRRAAVEVRHREGYDAAPDPPSDDRNRAAQIRSAVVSPLEAGGVRLKVKAESGANLNVAAIVDTADIAFEQRDGRWTAVLDFALALRAADGRDLATTFYTLRPDFDDPRHADAVARGVGFAKSVPLPADAAEARVVVVDRASGRLGSVIVPLRR